MPLFLDIETDIYQNITVIGFYSESVGFHQVIGSEITRHRLSRRLPKADMPDRPAPRELVTFNGHCFDLPVIKKRLGLDLRAAYDSRDLRFICQKHGLTGGQKAIEKALGIKRDLPDMDGRDAMYLWQDYLDRGSKGSLAILLAYNREDVLNLVKIAEYLKIVRCPIKPFAKTMV